MTLDNEYKGKDGFLYCKKCGKKRETEVEFDGKKKRLRCACECVLAERKAIAEREREKTLQKRREACFEKSVLACWTFENDDESLPQITNAMKNYAEKFPEFAKDGKGIMLYGPCGTGKTFYAACVANTLIEKGYKVKMTNFAKIANDLQGRYDGREEYLQSLNKCDLLVLDDLGAERKSDYMQEIVFSVIDSRYRSGKPMIITTNLSGSEIKNPETLGTTRIYDRLLEKCFPIEVAGTSKRRKKLKDTYESTKRMLGL